MPKVYIPKLDIKNVMQFEIFKKKTFENKLENLFFFGGGYKRQTQLFII
jgi:hypothetical protein